MPVPANGQYISEYFALKIEAQMSGVAEADITKQYRASTTQAWLTSSNFPVEMRGGIGADKKCNITIQGGDSQNPRDIPQDVVTYVTGLYPSPATVTHPSENKSLMTISFTINSLTDWKKYSLHELLNEGTYLRMPEKDDIPPIMFYEIDN